MAKPDTTVTRPEILMDLDTLHAIQNFDDVARLFGEAPAIAGEVIGDGFSEVDEDGKSDLVDKEMLIVKYGLATSDYDETKEYAVVWALVKMRGGGIFKARFTDGGVGIPQQLRQLHNKGITGNIWTPGGLVRSDYKYTDDKGNEQPATTYYINTDVPVS